MWPLIRVSLQTREERECVGLHLHHSRRSVLGRFTRILCIYAHKRLGVIIILNEKRSFGQSSLIKQHRCHIYHLFTFAVKRLCKKITLTPVFSQGAKLALSNSSELRVLLENKFPASATFLTDCQCFYIQNFAKTSKQRGRPHKTHLFLSLSYRDDRRPCHLKTRSRSSSNYSDGQTSQKRAKKSKTHTQQTFTIKFLRFLLIHVFYQMLLY